MLWYLRFESMYCCVRINVTLWRRTFADTLFSFSGSPRPRVHAPVDLTTLPYDVKERLLSVLRVVGVPSLRFQAKTMVDSFLPVSLVVHNSSPWPIDVIVEVTSTCEGREEEGSTSWGDDDADDSGGGVMWSGMPRCVVDHVPHRSPSIIYDSVMHVFFWCASTPGNGHRLRCR